MSCCGVRRRIEHRASSIDDDDVWRSIDFNRCVQLNRSGFCGSAVRCEAVRKCMCIIELVRACADTLDIVVGAVGQTQSRGFSVQSIVRAAACTQRAKQRIAVVVVNRDRTTTTV